MSFIDLRNLTVSYSKKTSILQDYSLTIEKGELVSLLGPSGCGKTTTLRTLMGFLKPSSGEIYMENKNITSIPVNRRNFGVVFQSYALFSHMTIFQNVAFGLTLRKISRTVIAEKVRSMLEMVNLLEMENRLPSQLSGGQRQRVALARALVITPNLLLLDEPLSNLDAKLRLEMRQSIRQIQQNLGITTLFVTHDQEECFSISDRVAVMNNGCIEQYDTPVEIYQNPKTLFAARFVGFKNFFTLEKKAQENISAAGSLKLTHSLEKENATATIRPQNITFAANDKDENCIKGTILVKTYLGQEYQYLVDTPLGPITLQETLENQRNEGEHILLTFPKESIITF